MLYGADVASFQGAPGQWRGEAGHIVWAAVKLTELQPDGTRYVNPDAKADWDYLLAQGKGRIAYMFGHPATDPAQAVELLAQQFAVLGLLDGDGIALDLEVTDGKSAAEVDAWASAVMADLERRFSRKPLLYTFIDFAQQGNCASLGGYPLWISAPSYPEGRPLVPGPWKTWLVHQYSTSAPIDRDVAARENLAELRAALGKPPAWVDYLTPGGVSLRAIAHAGGTWVPTVLERTEQAFGSQHDMFAYIGAGNWDAPMPAGVRLRVPAGTHVTPKHRRRPVRKAARAATGAAQAGISGTRSFTRGEPVMTAGGVLAVLASVLGWALPHAGVHWDHAVNGSVLTALTGLAGLWAALRVTRPSVAAVTAALGALASAADTFGLHAPAVLVAMQTPVAALIVALLLRGHVSPKGTTVATPLIASVSQVRSVDLAAEIGVAVARLERVLSGAQAVAALPVPPPAPDTAPPAVPPPGEVQASA